MARIYPGMGFIDGLTVICDGNPGAMQVVAALVKRSWLADVIRLDDMGIYGADIWVLFKDTCHEDLDGLHAELLRMDADRRVYS